MSVQLYKDREKQDAYDQGYFQYRSNKCILVWFKSYLSM
jgi:hypothetical protein